MTTSTLDLFSIGIGPSSSHTVGPMRAASRFVDMIGDGIESVSSLKVTLYGSLGATGRGHGSDGAVILGLMGADPETVDVDKVPQLLEEVLQRASLMLAGHHEIPFKDGEHLVLAPGKRLPFHPNGMEFIALDDRGAVLLEQVFYSIGGGFVVTADEAADDQAVSLSQRKPQPYPFGSASELLDHAARTGLTIAALMRANEISLHGESLLMKHLDAVWHVMQASVARGCQIEGTMPGLGVPRRAPGLFRHLEAMKEENTQDPLSVMDWVNLYALAVNEENATGGRVVTAPTNGAAGIIPAVLHYYINFVTEANQAGVHDFLLTAAAIGKLFKENASISGAEVGCQGEVGSACSMAAGGLAAVLGGTPAQVENAAEIGMEHNLGLTCDPIGGLVQVPCIERNAMAAVKAINAARLALKGDGTHFVSLDKVIRTMRITGRDMKTHYKETARGGLAVTVPISATVVDC